MKNSALFVSATKWKNGLSASRPNDDQRGQRQRRGHERLAERPAEAALAAAEERRGHDEQRRDREVLEQQHREARAPDRGAEPLAFDRAPG